MRRNPSEASSIVMPSRTRSSTARPEPCSSSLACSSSRRYSRETFFFRLTPTYATLWWPSEARYPESSRTALRRSRSTLGSAPAVPPASRITVGQVGTKLSRNSVPGLARISPARLPAMARCTVLRL